MADEKTFQLEDFDEVVLKCASDEECMREYLLRRGANQSQIDEILRKLEEERNA